MRRAEVPVGAKLLTDHCPFVAQLVVQLVELLLLLPAPLLTRKRRVEVVVVPELRQPLPLSALLACPPREAVFPLELLGNQAPFIDAQALVEPLQSLILFFAPGSSLIIFIIKHSIILQPQLYTSSHL